jgi:gamma-glutamylcyclotransferase (GGCT)/AIG2-like uncharacterized protein YtfP
MDADPQREPLAAIQRLVAYGTLAPGRPNHHQLDGVAGRWLEGQVHGTLVDAGWGATFGYPALVLDPAGPAVDVQVFESADLPAHWPRLDEFEGPGHQRVVTTVRTNSCGIAASIYILDCAGPEALRGAGCGGGQHPPPADRPSRSAAGQAREADR